jgi:hypothetical protein
MLSLVTPVFALVTALGAALAMLGIVPAGPAWAAGAMPNAVSATTAYFDPIIQTVLQGLAVAIAGGIIWLIKRGLAYLGLKISADQADAYSDALTKLVQSGAAKLDNDVIVAKGWDHVDVKNATIANALNGAAAKFPEALAGVGLDPAAPDFNAKLQAGLERVYATAMIPVAASPVTPPAPPPLAWAPAAAMPDPFVRRPADSLMQGA